MPLALIHKQIDLSGKWLHQVESAISGSFSKRMLANTTTFRSTSLTRHKTHFWLKKMTINGQSFNYVQVYQSRFWAKCFSEIGPSF